jgi:DivIVA domain-containing protein
MEMSPNQVRTATFASARKGFDPDEVTNFLDRAAEALEAAQNHATAMEARARAAVAKLQEMSSGEQAPAAERSTERHPEADTISRTLLLAQRAADEAIAEARADAEQILADAREAARNEGAAEREEVRSEVDSLMARREFLHSDVEQLENFLLDQRERLRSAASTLVEVAEKVPGGLGYLRPPLLSASNDDADESNGLPDSIHLADLADRDSTASDSKASDSTDRDSTDRDSTASESTADEPTADESFVTDHDEATEGLPVIMLADEHDRDGADRARSGDPTPESTQLRFAPGESPEPTPGSGR